MYPLPLYANIQMNNAEKHSVQSYLPITFQEQLIKQSCCLSLNQVQLFATPWTVAHQPPLSTGFSRQEYRNGLPCPLPGDLGSNPGLMSPALAGSFFTTSATWEAHGVMHSLSNAMLMVSGRSSKVKSRRTQTRN